MRMLGFPFLLRFTGCSYYRKRIKCVNAVPNQILRLLSTVKNEFKYFNLNNPNPEISISALMSQHKENMFSHRIMESNPNFNVVCFSKMKSDLLNISENVDIDAVLSNPNLVDFSIDDLFCAFKLASIDASTKSLKPISNDKYDNLSKAIVCRANEFSDDQIASILLYLSLWPMSESSRANNFNRVWKTLDDICCDRKKNWSLHKIFYYIDLWYLLKLTRISDFVFHSINILHKKINQLTSEQIVQLLFYLNTIRSAHKGITMYNLEHKLEGFADKISLEELGIAALGFFKTHTSLRSEELVKYIMKRTVDEIDNIPEITLASILKCLRLSMHIKVWKELPNLLDAITPQMHRYSLQCLTHVALLTAPSQMLHPPSLDYVSQRLIDDIKISRLKDMEKVLFPLSRLDYNPKTDKCVYTTVVEELCSPCRNEEINTFPKCFIALLHCLSLRSIFPPTLLSKALDMDFIHKAYGQKRYFFGRELAFIDTCIELEYRDYNGPRLPSETRSYLYKRYSHYEPKVEFKMSKHDKLSYDVLTTAKALLGKQSARFLYTVPSHPRPDVVVRAKGLPEHFMSLPHYENPVRSPCDDTICLVIVSKNMLCPNINFRLAGETMSKLRSIRILGYTPKLVKYNEWPIDGNLSEKEQCLEKILSSDCST